MLTRTDGVSAVTRDGLTEAEATPGLVREVAFATQRAMLIHATCGGHITSGWHHHGTREVLGHVMRGRVRFEFGPDGSESTEVEEGGFFHVPAGLVHRDVNPGAQPQDLVISFVGTGPLVVNVDGPDRA
jgi:uncharacterized RmlC-like cupin family protein